MASLYDRLAAIKKERAAQSSEALPPAARGKPVSAPRREREGSEKREPVLPGFRLVEEDVYRRDLGVPLAAGEKEALEAAAAVLAPGTAPGKLLFFDTETTGLSGGAGTVAFLFGGAMLEKGELRLVQLFLADYPGEPAFLDHVGRELEESEKLVSFNGKTFDGPLLRTRFVLNRLARELPAQVDLLFPSRRIWKTVLEDCSLGSLERTILGKTRDRDLPGAFAPQAYFDFLRTGETEEILRVIEHNKEDILSLEALFRHVGSLALDPASARIADPAGLGIFAAERNPAVGLPFLKGQAAAGNARAMSWLHRYLKRREAWQEAAEVLLPWKEKSLYAGIELAKHYEHRLRDPEAALEIIEGHMKKPGAEANLEELGRRRDRLVRKIRKIRRT